MKFTLIGHGAEAKIYLIETEEKSDYYIFNFTPEILKEMEIEIKEPFSIKYIENKIILKYRYKKKYRNEIIDYEFRKNRTRIERKILNKLKNVINIPELIYYDDENGIIIMEYIDGYKLSEYLEKLDYEKILYEIGKNIGLIHKNKIVHGDITTGNIIYKNGKIYFIDFGLSFFSNRIEDFAVDLHLFKETFGSNHWRISDKFDIVLEGYKEGFPEKYDDIFKRLKVVESRGRYKSILF
ncbi:MAG: KEOPS complex kinase/ATPase Bud32 [Nanopusillaceae archaeon]